MAGGLAPAVAPAAGRALEAVLADHAAAVAAAESIHEMAEGAFALGQRLMDLDVADPPGDRDARRRQAGQLRRETAEACRARFAAALRQDLLEPAIRAAAGPRAEDAVVAGLEAAARDLRRLEAAGRRLGQEVAFDRLVAEAVPKLLDLARPPRGLGRAEVARLVEILAGPQAALPLLDLPAG